MMKFKISNFKIANSRGFTFIEILLVITILVILVALIIPTFRLFSLRADLNNTSEEIISILRLVQSKTLASEGPAQYGVYFDDTPTPHQYTLFKGSDYASRDSSFDNVYRLPSKVEIYEINLGGGKEVVFNRIDGTANMIYSAQEARDNAISKIKVINISSSGRVFIGDEVMCCQNGRHIHFKYNEDTQAATTLSLTFPDWPGDNFDINFQDYLNADKSEFRWTGSISVGPVGSKTEQKLIIHTHSLTPAATQFCVHRLLPKGQIYNDKTLNISLDGEELVKFSADGLVTKGSSLNVEDPEYN